LLVAQLFSSIAKCAASSHTLEKITSGGVRFAALLSTAFWNFYGVCFTDIGAPSTLFGLAIAVSAAGEIPLYFLANPIIKRFGIERALLASFLRSALRLFAYAFVGIPKVAIWIALCKGVSAPSSFVDSPSAVHRPINWATRAETANSSCKS
jgi:hypothetical protein